MTGAAPTEHVRSVVAALLGFAAAEEQALLGRDPAEAGDAACWAAAPLVAHNTEFKQQQVRRLEAILAASTPPEFAEIDHRSPEVYGRYAAQPAAAVAEASWQATGALLGGLRMMSSDDLLDPARNPWLRGRQLWLQIVVRGFWHPTGHLGDFYLAHGLPDRAIDLAARAVCTAASLDAPDPARGMASYNLACAQAIAGRADEAMAALTEATRRNPDLRAKATSDPDLRTLRDAGLLS